MNITYILIGLLFFLNPNIEIIDILPDFIGAILILKGISHISAVDEKAGFARKSILSFVYVNGAKTLALLSLTVLNPANMTWMLVFTFTFGLIEAGLLIYFFAMMNKSLIYTSMVFDSKEVYNNSESFAGLSIAFVIVKVIMSILPELVSLFDIDYGYVHNFDINWSFVSLMLMVLNVLVVLLMGTVWYVNSFKYLKKVGKEKKYLDAIDEKYDAEVGSNHALLTYRGFKTLSLILVAASVFLICVRLDGLDYLPDFCAGILLAAAGLRIWNLYRKSAKKIVISAGIFLAIATAEWIMWLLFCNKYYSTENATISFIKKLEIYRGLDPDVDNRYLFICLLDFLKSISGTVTFIFIHGCIKDVIRDHTGAIPELRSETTEKKTAKIKMAMTVLTVIYTSLAVITLFSDPIAVLLCFDIEVLIFVSAIIGLLFTLYTWIYTWRLTEAIENKYLY